MLINRNRLVGNFLPMLNTTKSSVRDYLIKQLPSATAFINTDFEVVHASDRWIDSFDFSGPQVFGTTIFELLGEIGERWRPVLTNCFQGVSSGLDIDSHINEDGTEVHIQWKNLPWYDENENIVGAIIQKEDISQKLANEQKLAKLDVFLQEKSETAKIGSWESPVEGEIWWDDMTRKIHGVSENYIPTSKTVFSFYKEGTSKQKILKAVKEARKNGKPWSERLQIITPNGKEKWVISAGKPVFKKGVFMGFIGTFQDVTKRVLKDAKTKANERLLKTLIDYLPINIYVKNTEFKKILVNKQELNFYGLQNEDEIIGKADTHFMSTISAQMINEEDQYVLNTAEPILSKEKSVVMKNGKELTVLSSKIPMRDDKGIVTGIIGFSLDISDLKNKEEELRNLINVTSSQNKKLVDFAHIVSHNLRSHAANFSMLLEFLVSENKESKKKKIIDMLITASDGLLETLDNLNDVVAISTTTTLDKKPVLLKEAIHSVVNDLTKWLQSNKALVINEVADDIKIKVVPHYLENILKNFITNGVKYKEPSRDPIIKLKAEVEQNRLVLTIEDNGVGIDLKKNGDKLFGMYKTFHQNEDARGIGLYITKNQIEAMKGQVKVQSKVGAGTTFKIYFNGKNQ